MKSLDTLTPVDTNKIKLFIFHNNGPEKIKNYFICKSIDRIIEAYSFYKPMFFWNKRKTLIEWGKTSVFNTTNIDWYRWDNIYETFIDIMKINVEISKNEVVYLSDDYARKYSEITTILNTFDHDKTKKYKIEYKELWDYLDK